MIVFWLQVAHSTNCSPKRNCYVNSFMYTVLCYGMEDYKWMSSFTFIRVHFYESLKYWGTDTMYKTFLLHW